MDSGTDQSEIQGFLLTSKNYRVLPWKNGCGSTVELFIEPRSADFSKDPFIWRMSSAIISTSGPFSKFPGYDRWIMVLGGEGMTLTHNDFDKVIHLGKFEPYRFLGEWETNAQIVGAEVKDFNVMVRRDSADAHLSVYTLNTVGVCLRFDTQKSFIFCIKGELRVGVKKNGLSFEINTDQSVLLEQKENSTAQSEVDLNALRGECVVAVATLMSPRGEY